MEILSHKNHRQLLDYLPYIRSTLREWILVDVRLVQGAARKVTILDISTLLHRLMGEREGKLYICNEREILMLLRWDSALPFEQVALQVEAALPMGACTVTAHAPTPEGLAKFEMVVAASADIGLGDIRPRGKNNIILVADDDMYMRLMVKKGAGTQYEVHEAADGLEAVEAYKKYMPNILFLDIHMPHMDGTDTLGEILKVDPNGYIVMLSADSSRENVSLTVHRGAKGFLTKPFTKEKLQDYIRACPTIAI
jgi:two-component system chemotaxis response regulator CheY